MSAIRIDAEPEQTIYRGYSMQPFNKNFKLMKFNFKKAIINFVWAYIVVTILAYSLSYLVGSIFNLPSYIDLGVSLFNDPAFVATVPYHLLINLLCWTFFTHFYFRKKESDAYRLKESIFLGIFWLIMAMIVDLTGFVLIKSPVSLTPHQFYVEYQPWISITYLIVLVSPLVYLGLTKLKSYGFNV